jgi:hypothetical protein
VGEIKIAAPMSLIWFFQHPHRPCVQYGMGLVFPHELLEVQKEQQDWWRWRSMEEISKVSQFLS